MKNVRLRLSKPKHSCGFVTRHWLGHPDAQAHGFTAKRKTLPILHCPGGINISNHSEVVSVHSEVVSIHSGLISDHSDLVFDHFEVSSDHSVVISDHSDLISNHSGVVSVHLGDVSVLTKYFR